MVGEALKVAEEMLRNTSFVPIASQFLLSSAAEAGVTQRLIRENLRQQLKEAHTAAEARVAQRSIKNDLKKQLVEARIGTAFKSY